MNRLENCNSALGLYIDAQANHEATACVKMCTILWRGQYGNTRFRHRKLTMWSGPEADALASRLSAIPVQAVVRCGMVIDGLMQTCPQSVASSGSTHRVLLFIHL